MPSRFSHLEFEDEDNRTEQAGLQPALPAETYLTQANGCYRLGRFEQALRLYTRCLREDAGTVEAWVGQVRMLVELGEFNEARLWSDKALEVFRGNGELLAAKAQSCARLKDFKAAYSCSDASLTSPGSSPWRWEARGEVLLAQGDSKCQRCFEKALVEPLADWFDRVVLARIYMYYGRMTNAIEHAREALAAEPGNSLIWLTLGSCQQALGLRKEAAVSYRRTLEVDPRCREARAALESLDSGSFLGYLGGIFRRWRRR
jgi:tetratricopeptide (TPR) repeat protein